MGKITDPEEIYEALKADPEFSEHTTLEVKNGEKLVILTSETGERLTIPALEVSNV